MQFWISIAEFWDDEMEKTIDDSAAMFLCRTQESRAVISVYFETTERHGSGENGGAHGHFGM